MNILLGIVGALIVVGAFAIVILNVFRDARVGEAPRELWDEDDDDDDDLGTGGMAVGAT